MVVVLVLMPMAGMTGGDLFADLADLTSVRALTVYGTCGAMAFLFLFPFSIAWLRERALFARLSKVLAEEEFRTLWICVEFAGSATRSPTRVLCFSDTQLLILSPQSTGSWDIAGLERWPNSEVKATFEPTGAAQRFFNFRNFSLELAGGSRRFAMRSAPAILGELQALRHNPAGD